MISYNKKFKRRKNDMSDEKVLTNNDEQCNETVSNTADYIRCNSMEELENVVNESSELIKDRHDMMIDIPYAKVPLYCVKRIQDTPDYDEDGNELGLMLIYDEYFVLFTEVEYANRFLKSFMDESMLENCIVYPLTTYGELEDIIGTGIIADNLIMRRVEFKDENDVWHCEDVLYDPNV